MKYERVQYDAAAGEALARAGGVCEMCGSMRPYRTIPPFREYPEVLAFDRQYLTAVCRPCFVMCWALRRRRAWLRWWARVWGRGKG